MALTVLQMVPALRGGGVETGTVDLARALTRAGHRAIVVSSGGPLVRELEAAGAIHYTLPVHRKLPWGYPAAAARVAEVIESHGVDVIHARSRVPALIGYWAWRRAAARTGFGEGRRQHLPVFVTTAHGHYATHPFSRVMGWGRRVIANSERIARHMIDDFGVPPDRVRLIPRGVDLSRYPWAPPRPEAPRGEWLIVSVGRLTPLKGHPDLIRAFGVLSKAFPRARLLIAGEAPRRHERYLRTLRNLVAELDLGDRVEFRGHERDVPALLKRADLLVLSSRGEEAFGRVLIEAGAAGVPVIASRVGGVAEVIADHKTGLLVPPRDPMALAQAMTALLKDRKTALAYSRQNRCRVEERYPLSRMVNDTLRVYRESCEGLRILVMKLSAVGDVVLATPSLRALRNRFPKAHITAAVGHPAHELLQRSPYVDDLAVFDRDRDGSLRGMLAFGRRLARAQVDLVVDLQNNRISHWLGLLSGAPLRFGYAGRRWSGLLNHRVRLPDTPLGPVEQQFRLLRLLGIRSACPKTELWLGPSDEARADEILRGAWVARSQPLIVLHPGAGWESKRWPEAHCARLIDLLAERTGGRVVLTGSAEERPLSERIYRKTQAKPILAAGATSLGELAALLKRARVFVGGDTAALHIAAAVGVPTVALFGPTDPARHLPPAERQTVFRKPLPCSPCYRSQCWRKGEGYMECLKSFTPEEAAEAVLGLLRF